MEIIGNLNFQLNNTAVCIGKFDGMHRGHRFLMAEAKKERLTAVMFTFLFDDASFLYGREEKRVLAESLGVDILLEIPATEQFLGMSPEDFVRDILAGRCDAKKVVVGEDFRFGYQRMGDAKFLQEAGENFGIQVLAIEKLREEGEIISSTRIRKLLSQGKMYPVNKMLVTPYFIRGTVRRGKKLGRTMEVPTANICPQQGKVLPPFGVYAVFVENEGEIYSGIGNLGVKPTIPGKNPAGLEVWLFDYEGDLYDKEITVYLMDFQRKEKKFESLDKLHEQIVRDTEQAKKTLAHIMTEKKLHVGL